MVSEFLAAVNQICSERGIDPESVFVALESAVLVAYKRDFGEDGDVHIELDRESGVFRVIAKKAVVEKVADKNLEISLKESKKINSSLKVGDFVELELPIVEFGRIAAQTAKQVILQKIRESEKEAMLKEFSDKTGEVYTALMQRMQRGQAVFEIGKAVAFMPQEEQIPSEFYRIGERYKVMLKSIDDTPRGKELIVTRADPAFLGALFKMEVPEIESGVVEIKACAREAGSRSKIAVESHQDGVDPIGSCVGQKGMRIANVMSELGEEKIDVIEWDDDINDFVANALSPAKVEQVRVDNSLASVQVAEDQLSLAIGKDGQNVRLAAKLTNLKIDIHDGKSVAVEKKASKKEVLPVKTESKPKKVVAKKTASKTKPVKVAKEKNATSTKVATKKAVEKKTTKSKTTVKKVAEKKTVGKKKVTKAKK